MSNYEPYAQQPPEGQPPPQGGFPQYPSSPPPGAGQPQLGPIGQPRRVGICILLAFVTLGIYILVWAFKTEKELQMHTGRGVGGGLGILLFIFGGGAYIIPHEIEDMMALSGRPSAVSTKTGFWMLLPYAGGIVWVVKVQGQLNEYWRSLGAQS